MGGEKRDSGGGPPGGFFQLFDRNGKSKWKKLFSNNSSVTVELEQSKLEEEKLQTINFHMMDDEKKSECSRPSSISVEEEGVGIKAPSVVARLMGLESLPSVDVLEANSTPFHENRLVHGPNKYLEFGSSQYQNLPSVRQSTDLETLPCKIVVPRPQKLQKMSFVEKRPIMRFQTETLLAKPVKSYSDIQHRLLSPIKSSGFVSAKNGAHLMETAAKILDPGLHPAARIRSQLVGPSSIPLKDRGRSEEVVSSYRVSKPLELPKKFSVPNAVKLLSGQAMNKSWNGSDDSSISMAASEGRLSKNFSSSLSSQNNAENNQKLPFSSTKREKQVATPHCFPNCEDGKPVFPSNQGKSISLAIQAKVNVQRRESLSCSSLVRPNNTRISGLLVQDEQDERGLSRQRKSQLNLQKNKQKQATSGTRNVLRQNNQKQNRLPSKPTGLNQHTRKGMPGDASSGQKLTNHEGVRDRIVSGRNVCGQSKKVACSRTAEKGMDKSDLEKKTCLSRTSNLPQKKRSIEGGFHSAKNGFVDNILIDGGRTRRETSTVANGYINKVECNKRSLWNGEQPVSSSSKSMDVVSFTFTSPLSSTSGSCSNELASNKQNIKKGCFADSFVEKNMSSTKSSKMFVPGSMTFGGDTLSALLEKKLRELTSGIQMASSLNAANSGSANTASILQDFLATLNSGVSISKEHDAECLSIPQENDVYYRCIDEADSFSSSTPLVDANLKFQVQETVNEQNSEAQRGHLDLIKMNVVEDNERLSPVSILDAASSNDSCNSVESSDGIYGGQLDQSCQNSMMSPSVVAATDKELLDSATSVCMVSMVERPCFSETRLPEEPVANNGKELEYVRDIIVNSRLTFEDMAVGLHGGLVDPLLFDRLASTNAISVSVDCEKQIRSERKLWFDCVSECVDSKYGCYSRGDCRNWTKGVAVVGKAGLAEEVFKEMLGWRSMGELMVDEMLYKDMSIGPGRWTDFENEEFEMGLEVEEDILDSLIEEVVIYTFGLES